MEAKTWKAALEAAPEPLNDLPEITYLYLTFESELPKVNTTKNVAKAPLEQPPSAPDLSPYVDPMQWPRSRKNVMLLLSCIATFMSGYSAGAYSPPAPLMTADLDAPSNTAVLAGITTFCIGFALAPMVLAPFSEINGRYPVFVVSGFIFVIFQAICGLVNNLAGLLVARFLVGVGGSVFSTMVGGVISDLWEKQDRNTPMALFSGAVLAGTGAGPLIGGLMAERFAGLGHGISAPWRWVFWHQVIMNGVLMVTLLFLFKESRGSVLLSRKARALNNWYDEMEKAGCCGVWVDGRVDTTGCPREPSNFKSHGATISDEEKCLSTAAESTSASHGSYKRLLRVRWLVKADEERSSIGKMISISVSRPFFLLVTEPVVFFFSLWVSFAWAVLYLTFACIPLVFQRQHGWDIETSCRIFVAMIVGAIIATGIGLWQEHILHHPQWTTTSQTISEAEGDISDRASKSESCHPSSHFWAFLRRRFPPEVPESRLYFTCVTATLLPISLFIFGLASRPDVHWIVPALAVGLGTIGIYSVYLAVFNYFADTYHRYASSALAAQSCCRNILGGIFPLVSTALFTNLGEARAGVLLGGIATLLTLVPWILVFYGEKIRARSRFASVSLIPSKLSWP
jgi:multidrug resistance protein